MSVEYEICPTLRAEAHGNLPCVLHAVEAGGNSVPSVCVCYDARGNGDGKTAPTITGDHNNRVTDYTALTLEPVYCLQGNGIDRADTAGCDGKGWKEDICYTLNTIDRPAVVYSIGNDQANSLRMEEIAKPLDCMQWAAMEGATLRKTGRPRA